MSLTFNSNGSPGLRRVFAAMIAAASITWLCCGLAPATLSLISAAHADGGKGGGGDSGGGDGGGDDGGGDDGGSSNSGSGSANSGQDNDDDNDDDDDDDDNDDDGHVDSASGRAGSDRSGRDYIPDEIVVGNLTDPARADIRDLGFTVIGEETFEALGLSVVRLRVPKSLTAPSARTLLASRYPDLLVDLNALYRPQGQDMLPAADYGARLIGWGRASRDCGRGMRIGIVDTAVDDAVPALARAQIVQRSFLPQELPTAGPDHGTAVAAILVGQPDDGGQGLLPRAELHVAEVFAADPDGKPVAEVMALVGGLNWLFEQRVPVINLSLAGEANDVVGLALRRIVAGSTAVIAAAGNEGPSAPPAFPAAESGVIAVTALDSRREPYADANQGAFVDLAAPGVRVWTPGADALGHYNTGTSFAAPFVTAAVATEIANGDISPDRVVEVLAESAVDLGAPGKDPVFGWGLLQANPPCGTQTQ